MTRNWLFSVVALIASAGLFVTKAQDQDSARGNLSGVVYDASKGTVAGAQVTITGPISSLSQNTTEQGTFLFSTLIPGNYSVKVQKTGFKVAEFKRVEVLINKTTSIEAILETGEISQVVEVTAATVTVDTSSSSIAAEISKTFNKKTP